MKTSNVSFENLLGQLSEEKINRVVDRAALRAGTLDLLFPPAGDSGKSQSSGTNSSSRSGGTGSTTGNNDNCPPPFGICI